ncbi:hypothetical protein KRH_07600 [Kocuria rhizophila DC2201]|uniref:Uncharacterized protein n=1 Tax=Kocuria rhizophila (strain ATCC 9341 / DSM 348 / NBRC 103217 / DC2201) TaxID=378753 RepID=B2GK87_KOCRD|nr:hypothetical protein KRH_07600 [Kocuria rhizophila DC2201]
MHPQRDRPAGRGRTAVRGTEDLLPFAGAPELGSGRGLGVGSRRLDASMPHHIRVLGCGDG